MAPDFLADLALVQAEVGREDAAIDTLAELLGMPGRAVSAALLTRDPLWAGLRNNPRFRALADADESGG